MTTYAIKTTNGAYLREAMLARVNGAKNYDLAALAVAHAVLTGDAIATHSKYPQYKDHWDGWGLCRVLVRVKTKAGVAFERGDLALYKVERRDTFGEPPLVVTLYSNRNGVDTTIGATIREVNREMSVLLPPSRRDRDQGRYPNG
jgi:hypothetical protein